MENKYVLLVCPILKDGRDISGNPYMGIGEFIQAKSFSRDGNTDTGLYGILWGKCSIKLREYLLKLNWAVVKTELNENLVMLNRETNEAKFKRGIILHMGKIETCSQYIMNIKDDEQQFFHRDSKQLTEEQLIGSIEWNKKLREITW